MEPDSPHIPKLLRNDEDESIQAHRFAHKAMATIFEVVCIHEDRGYAEQAARARNPYLAGRPYTSTSM